MKLSVKLITALAAFVLLVVGLVGLASSGSTARAAVDAKVFVANESSKLTNDSTPLSGYTFAGSGKTIYSTFVEVNDASDVAQTSIASSADRVTIFVEDADADKVVPKSSTTSSAFPTGFTTTSGTTMTVVLSTADSPIVDTGTAGILDGTDITVTSTPANLLSLQGAFAGSSSSGGSVTVVRNATAGTVTSFVLNWKTSAIDSVTVKVTTTQDSTGKTFTIKESSASSGIFKGSIDLVDVQASSTLKGASTSADGDKIAIQNSGVVTVSYTDTTPVSGSSKTFKTTAIAETGAPVVTITSPSNGSATQVRRPTFAGSVTDTTSGLDVSTVLVFIDTSNDPGNSTPVDSVGTSADENTPSLPTGTADGASSSTFTFTPAVDIPTIGTGSADHTVDWQVRATDLAGNIGWSDSSSTTANTAGVGQVNTVKVDQTLPGITEVYTGFVLDNTGTTPVRKVNNKKSIEINFNDNIDSSTVVNTDFEVVTGGVTQVPTAAAVGGKGFTDRVFLTLASDLKTNDIPTVKVVGSIADAAGNTTSTGSKVAKDALAPTITVTLSGGSSATAPTTLTKSAMTITITSDENLSSDPVVEIYNEGTTSSAEGTVTAVNQGSNTWIASFSGSAFDGSTADGKKKSVRVIANDATSLVASSDKVGGDTTVPTGTVIGQATKGKTDTAASGAIVFSLDKTAPTLTLSPSGDTSDDSPFVRWDFGEVVTVSKAEFGLSTATLTDVTTELGTSDNKVYVRATSGLALGTYKATGTATDLAGNKATGLSSTFKVIARAKLKLTLFPGTTLVSFPLTPSDTSVSSVFSPAGVVSVSAYDTATGTFTSAVRDATTGALTGTLATVESGRGYIVVADAVSALSVPIPSLSAASIPPSIPLAAGWNLVGVTDVTGDSTGKLRQPGSTIGQTRADYFPSKVTQVYDWDATAKVWKQVATTDSVLVGDAYWAFATIADVIVP